MTAWISWFHKCASKIHILEAQLGLKLSPVLRPLFAHRAKELMMSKPTFENQTLPKPKQFIVMYSNGCIYLKPDKPAQITNTSYLDLKTISNLDIFHILSSYLMSMVSFKTNKMSNLPDMAWNPNHSSLGPFLTIPHLC